jgi:hypothetical protein
LLCWDDCIDLQYMFFPQQLAGSCAKLDTWASW